MKRRLTIARSLINDPELLLLDEPTTGLDPQARHVVWERLFRLKQQGVTLVLTTHYMDEAEQLCDRLVVMDHGRIAAEGSPAELIAAHSSREVVELRFSALDHADHAPALDGIGRRVEVLPDRLLLYVDDGDAAVAAVHARGRAPDAACSCAAAPSRTSSCGSPAARWWTDMTIADRRAAESSPHADLVRATRTGGRLQGHLAGHVFTAVLVPVLNLLALGYGLGTLVDASGGLRRHPLRRVPRPRACSRRQR